MAPSSRPPSLQELLSSPVPSSLSPSFTLQCASDALEAGEIAFMVEVERVGLHFLREAVLAHRGA
jgi:hypothetical protein